MTRQSETTEQREYRRKKLAMPDIGAGEFLTKVGNACANRGMSVVLYTDAKPESAEALPY